MPSHFTMTLPPEAGTGFAGAPGLVTPSRPRADTSEPRRALVVDDDPVLCRTLARILRRAGFETVDANSGRNAIAVLEAAPFDVVVSDVKMPNGDGLDLLREIRRIDLDVPVLLITGEPSLSTATAAVEYGAFRYLTKPLDGAALIEAAESAARAYALARLRREAFEVSGAHAAAVGRAEPVEFAHALDGLWMAFQPIVHARSGAVYGVEALMRSTEPTISTPMALLDAATQLDRLAILGRRVRALAATAFAARTDDVALFVNLHPDDLNDLELIDENSPLAAIAPRVILEITERATLKSSDSLVEHVARLRSLGFRLAVDDLGAGYSGLSSFTELAPEVVKIDMSIVRDIHRSEIKQRTVRAVCQLCHDVGTLVVGEGVETSDERDALAYLGCDLLQGFLLGRPTRELPG